MDFCSEFDQIREIADMVTFTEEIVNWGLRRLCSSVNSRNSLFNLLMQNVPQNSLTNYTAVTV